MKKSDEIGCAIICFVWELFFMLAAVKNTPLAWATLGFITVIEIVIIYFDDKIERIAKQAKRDRLLFSMQTANYLNSICKNAEANNDD